MGARFSKARRGVEAASAFAEITANKEGTENGEEVEVVAANATDIDDKATGPETKEDQCVIDTNVTPEKNEPVAENTTVVTSNITAEVAPSDTEPIETISSDTPTTEAVTVDDASTEAVSGKVETTVSEPINAESSMAEDGVSTANPNLLEMNESVSEDASDVIVMPTLNTQDDALLAQHVSSMEKTAADAKSNEEVLTEVSVNIVDTEQKETVASNESKSADLVSTENEMKISNKESDETNEHVDSKENEEKIPVMEVNEEGVKQLKAEEIVDVNIPGDENRKANGDVKHEGSNIIHQENEDVEVLPPPVVNEPEKLQENDLLKGSDDTSIGDLEMKDNKLPNDSDDTEKTSNSDLEIKDNNILVASEEQDIQILDTEQTIFKESDDLLSLDNVEENKIELVEEKDKITNENEQSNDKTTDDLLSMDYAEQSKIELGEEKDKITNENENEENNDKITDDLLSMDNAEKSNVELEEEKDNITNENEQTNDKTTDDLLSLDNAEKSAAEPEAETALQKDLIDEVNENDKNLTILDELENKVTDNGNPTDSLLDLVHEDTNNVNNNKLADGEPDSGHFSTLEFEPTGIETIGSQDLLFLENSKPQNGSKNENEDAPVDNLLDF